MTDAEWKTEREHILKRMDRFDSRFDKLDNIIQKQGEQFDTIIRKQSDRIDALRVDVLKIASNMSSFKNEFRLKTSAWAFLGTAIAISLAVIGYLIKNQLV